MVEKNLSLKLLAMLCMTCSLVTVIETTNYANGDKWGGENGILCWIDDGVPRFLIKESGYKKCSPKTCPWNALGPFRDVNCQICCHFEEEQKSLLNDLTACSQTVCRGWWNNDQCISPSVSLSSSSVISTLNETSGLYIDYSIIITGLTNTLSTNNWETIGKVTLPLSITLFVFLIGLVVAVAVYIIRRRMNKSSGGFEEGSPGSSQEYLDMIMTKNKLPKRKRHDSEKSCENKSVGEDVEKTLLS